MWSWWSNGTVCALTQLIVCYYVLETQNQSSRQKQARVILCGGWAERDANIWTGHSRTQGLRVHCGSRGSSNALRRTQSRWTLPSEELCHPATRKLCQIRVLHQEIPVGSRLMPGALAALFPAELLRCRTWICLHLKSALLWEDFSRNRKARRDSILGVCLWLSACCHQGVSEKIS